MLSSFTHAHAIPNPYGFLVWNTKKYFEECLCIYTTVQKFWVSKMEEINTFIQQGWIQLIKIDSKLFYIVLKDLFLNKGCSFELSIHQNHKKY